MHHWGDDWPYWDELYTAERFIADYVYKWSRCRLQSKEKWGTIRYERLYPPNPWGGCGLVIHAPWKKKYSWSNTRIKPILFMWTSCWLYYKWMKFGDYMLGRAVRKAIKKWPHIEKELTVDLNWSSSK